MPNPKCSDQAFIDLCNKLRSRKEIAAVLGMDGPHITARARRIEKRYGIRLPIDGRIQMHEALSRLYEGGEAIQTLDVQDGNVIVGSDAHYWPGIITTAHRAMVRFCKELRPVAVVMNGDAFDGASISRHPSIGWESKPDVMPELEAVTERLTELEDAAPNARRYWPAGNHDLRFETHLAAHAPQYRGVKGIHLKDHFPAWTPCWRLDVNPNGKQIVVIRHREKGGIHADYRNTVEGGVTIVTGHDHRLTVEPFIDYNDMPRWGVRTGMLAASPYEPQFVNYLEARRPNWMSGFVVLRFYKGRLLWPQVAHVIAEGQVAYAGQVIYV